MELERLSIELRPRNAWEAMDLGIRLTLQHARAIYASWLSVTLPCALLIIGGLGIGLHHPGWAMLIMWWLRPAFDRVVLYVVSHAVFDEVPGVRGTLQALPRILSPVRLLGSLTWRRIGMQRSLRLPVEMLEGLIGPAARHRRTLISRRVSGASTWQCLCWQTLELILTLSLFALCLLLIPSDILEQLSWDTFFRQEDHVQAVGQLVMVLFIVVHLLLEPMYVAGGFMLYLKRRNDLEAWDVELQFRRLARAHAARAGTALLPMLMACIVALCIYMPAPVSAADNATAPAAFSTRSSASAGDDEETDVDEPGSAPGRVGEKADDPSRHRAIDAAKENVEEILKKPEFGKNETYPTLGWRADETRAEKPWNLPDWFNNWLSAAGEFLRAIGAILAMLGRVGGWLLIAALSLATLYVILRYSRGWRVGGRRAAPPAALAGFDIRPQSLPADVAAAALALMREGHTREAMSLLFRGALSVLAHRDHVPFTRGDTEGDCLDRVRQHANARFAFLARLLGKWQELAYANRIVLPGEVESLCAEWSQHFATTPEARHGR